MPSSGSVLELILASPDGYQGSLLGIPVGGRANKAGEKLTQCTHVCNRDNNTGGGGVVEVSGR